MNIDIFLPGEFGARQVWAEELSQYFKTTPQKIIETYQKKRPQTAQLWGKKSRKNRKTSSLILSRNRLLYLSPKLLSSPQTSSRYCFSPTFKA